MRPDRNMGRVRASQSGTQRLGEKETMVSKKIKITCEYVTIFSKSIWYDGKGIGYTILTHIAIWNFSDRV